jgi:hypothetical protein
MRLAAAGAACFALTSLAACGGGGGGRDDTAIRSAVRGYFQAIVAHDAARACTALTPESREKIGEYARKLGQKRETGCQGTMRAFFTSGPMVETARTASKAEITRVDRRGDEAKATVTGVGPLELKRTGGVWRIAFEPAVEDD